MTSHIALTMILNALLPPQKQQNIAGAGGGGVGLPKHAYSCNDRPPQ